MLAVIAVKIKSFWQFLTPNRKRIGLVGFIICASLILTMWFAGTGQVFADVWGTVANIIGTILLTIAGWFIQITIFLLKFVITLGGYNGYIRSPAVNIGWIMVRDVTNMFFVIVLLIIAFATILGIEDYSWKKLLSKLIFAAVLVNFSRQIAGIIIDFAQVIMITFINGVAATAGGNLINMFNVNNILNLARQAKPNQITPGNIFLASLGGLVFSAIMMVTMGVFAIMLLARMVTLWVLIVLSPLAFILNVLPKTKAYADRWWKEFGNNVISGPLIAFFIWLAFVTLGSGDIQSDITNSTNNPLPDGDTWAAVDDAGVGQGTGVGGGMTWVALANFAIAIGMLMIGAKMAQELGVYGGAMMQKGVDFGKKVAMIASGASAARWAYQKGAKPAAKWALMNAPLVGGNKWINRGKAIANRARKVGIAWNEGLGGTSAGFIARHFQIGRTMKAREELERQATVLKGDLRSSTNVKRLKAETNRLEGLGEIKKLKSDTERKRQRAEAQKGYVESEKGEAYTETMQGAETAESMLAAAKALRETSFLATAAGGKQIAAKAETAQIQERLTTERELAQLKEIKKLLSRGGAGATRQVEIDTKKAALEYDKREHEKERELAVAIEKDKVLKGKGEKGVYENQVRETHVQEDEKRLATLNYREITERAGLYAKDTKKMDEEYEAKKRSGTLTAGDESEYQKNRARLSELVTASLTSANKRGSEEGMAALQGVMKVLGMNEEEIGAEDNAGQQRKIMSALLLKKIDGDPNAGMAEFQAMHKGSANVLLRNFYGSLERAGADGMPNYTGVINNKTVDDDGRVIYQLDKNDDKGRDSGYASGTKDYWIANVTVPKVHTLKGLVTSSDEKVTEDVKKIDDRSRKNFVSVFSKMTNGTKLDDRFVEEWKKMNKDVREELLRALEAENKQEAEILRRKLGSKAINGSAPTPNAGGTNGDEDDETEEENGASKHGE